MMEREILIQEEYVNEPWKMLVCCILLNQTNNKQVRPILKPLFELIPDYQSAICCPKESIAAIIKTTGFYNVKAGRIKRLSESWADFANTEGMSVKSLSGIGVYGKESWDIFILGRFPKIITDKKLRAYVDAIQACQTQEL